MSTVNFMGSYSGIDQTMIDQLMAVEKRPLIQLADKKTGMEAQKNAWNDVRTRLNNLFEKIKVLESAETYTSKNASSSGDSVEMTASKNSSEGTYQVHVSQLATSTAVIGGTIAAAEGDSSKALGITGSFNLNTDHQIDIATDDSVRTIADKINALQDQSGVRASIIDNRLVLNNIATGNTDIVLSDGDGTTLNSIGLGDTSTLNQGKNALFNINGVDVERSSNTVSDVVEYTTITLSKEHAIGDFDTVSVSLDTGKVETALDDFISQYNSTMQFIDSKLSAGQAGVEGSRGDLAGDGTLMRLQSTLRNMVSSTISNDNTEINNISEIGVTTIDKFGQLRFDKSKLSAALSENPEQIKNFFSSVNESGDKVGFVPRINSYIDGFVSSTGIIKGKTDTYDRTIKDISKQVDAFNIRMQRKEEYYITMFSRLDTAMMEAESQMNWLTSQIAGLTAGMVNKK